MFLLVLFSYCMVVITAAAVDKKNEAPYLCYVCLGYDLDNCQSGEAVCKNACMKLIDRENRLIAKGCATVDKQGTHHALAGVKLPWANNTEISGELHACQRRFCNFAYSATLPFAAVLGSMILAFLLAS